MSEENLSCVPCNLDGLTEPVYGYCQNCKEHLCETCFKHHRRSRPSRNHVLLDKEAMPKDQIMSNVKFSDETEFCASHIDKRLEFYCSKHKAIACYVCITLGHKACNVDYIPDISGNISESDEFNDLMAQLRMLREKCENSIKKAKHVTEQIQLDHVKVIEETKLFRKEINDCLDKMEAEFTKEFESVVNTSKSKLTNVNEACEEILGQVNDMESLLSILNEENQQNKLFVEVKRSGERLSLHKKEMENRESNETHGNTEFVRNQNLIELLKAETFGRIVIQNIEETTGQDTTGTEHTSSESSILPSEDKTVNLNCTGTINVRSSSDKKECDVRGIVLISPQNIIVADYANHSIKLIDKEMNTFVSEISLSSAPLDIILIPQNKLAVALASEKFIQILSLTGTSLSKDHRIDVENCRGLAYSQDKLIVGCNYNPGKVIILNLAGNVLKVFESQDFFYGPEKVVVSKDKNYIYTSDWYISNHRFVKIDWQGNVLQTFKGEGYEIPTGIQELDDGTFLVCYRDSNNVVRLSSSLKQCEITGLEKANICSPQALAYCEKERKLYVSCDTKKRKPTSTVKVFDVKWT